MQNRRSKITIADNNYLNIDLTNFTGDVDAAMTFVQDFCDTHKVSYKSYGHGYADLIIDGVTHDITPYGIDISMMIEFCGGKVSDFNKPSSPLVSAISLSGGSLLKQVTLPVDDFFSAALEGNVKNVAKYMAQNPDGSKDGDHDNPFYTAFQLAACSNNTKSRSIIEQMLKETKPVQTALDVEKNTAPTPK